MFKVSPVYIYTSCLFSKLGYQLLLFYLSILVLQLLDLLLPSLQLGCQLFLHLCERHSLLLVGLDILLNEDNHVKVV